MLRTNASVSPDNYLRSLRLVRDLLAYDVLPPFCETELARSEAALFAVKSRGQAAGRVVAKASEYVETLSANLAKQAALQFSIRARSAATRMPGTP
jgi:hypothetical protein